MSRSVLSVLFIVLGIFAKNAHSDSTPIVLWHGMGDACCLPFSLGPFKTFLEEQIPGVYVKSIEIGDSVVQDLENGYFMSPNEQVEVVCEQLKRDKRIRNGFHAVGFSQGSQFMRAVIQRCGHVIPNVYNFISLGGQHQGVYGIPNCGALKHSACDYIRRLLNHAAYHDWMQNLLAQATYWHDPLNEDLYKKHSKFLADINNENSVNETYVENLSKLYNFVMVKFNGDSIVQPVETEWFGFYRPGQAKEIESLRDSDLYREDRLGLRRMDEEGRLAFRSVDGNHLQFTEGWFVENILDVYLKT